MKINFIRVKSLAPFILFLLTSLPSFGQKALTDSVPDHIISYKLYYDYSGMYRVEMDTALVHFQISNYAYSDFAMNQYLGNLASAVLPILQQDNAGGYDLIFNKYVRYNFFKPENTVYYRTKSPYTNLLYYSSGPKSRQEQDFQFLHTQNVNKNLNVGIIGNLLYSDGVYANNLIKGNSFCIFSSLDGTRYNFNFSLNFSTLKTQENGGLFDDTYYEELSNPTYTLPVRLQNAQTVNKDLTLFLQHRFYLTGTYKEKDDSVKRESKWDEVVSVIHRMEYEKSSRSFTDDLNAVSSSSSDRDYYKTIYNDSSRTGDSAAFRRFENNFLLALNAFPLLKIPAEIRFGIKNQLDKVNYNTVVDTPYIMGNVLRNYINSAITGSLINRFSKTLSFGVSADLFFTGYKAGNIYLSGDLSKTVGNNFEMTLKGDFSLEKAPYFLQDYESNHFRWHNAFTAKQSITILKAIFEHRKLKATLSGESGSYINFLYFNSDTLPVMANNPFTMLRVSAKKYFDWKILHSMVRVSFQKSTNEIAMPLPVFSGFNSSFIELFSRNKVLQLQLGFDAYFNTAYYSKAYMPATGLFYSQSEIKTGGLPYVDMFLNIKIKRARLSLRYENVTWFAEDIRNYFSPHYPYNPGILKVGISWNFYD